MSEPTQKRPTDKLANTFGLTLFLGSIALFIVIGVFVPLSTPRITLNHYRAARSIRDVVNAESAFSSKFPALGYTCDMRALEQKHGTHDGLATIDSVLASGEKAGYRYELSGCQPQGKNTHYAITAIPKLPGVVGQYSFCADENGVVWYDDGGSFTGCLAERWPWKEQGSR